MATIGIELNDAGFLTAACDTNEPRLIDVADQNGSAEWPGYCYADGSNLTCGRAAEDMWFVPPRRVSHPFWARLTHEPSSLNLSTKPPSFSELAFFFLREFSERLKTTVRPLEQI